MQRDLILGTAGHIDHGKTALVKALTGIDCDRLPEEKVRGITIDIGFAHLELGDTRLGIVDVPGHERFIKNMLAGATGIDLALLVVAADDSVMPQTREHLEILKLLGLRHGVIALTKCDLVDDTTREVVGLEVRELVKDSFLADAAILATSAHSGLGIAELKYALAAAARSVSSQEMDEPFRLAIDRAFVAQGHGTVVTGSVASGFVKLGDELDWHKGNGEIEKVRVRGLNNHGHAVDEVHRGQRAAINLAGVPHEQVRRGQELAALHYLEPSKVLTVRLTASNEFRRAIKHRLPVRLHIGTAEVMATVSLLDCDRNEPGQWALAQLFLEDAVTAVWGQPFVLRDSSAEHTLGGGQVLQPVAAKIRRRHLEVLERIERLWSADPKERIRAAGWLAGTEGIAPTDLARDIGLSQSKAIILIEQLLEAQEFIRLRLTAFYQLTLHAERLAGLENRIVESILALHRENPLATTHDRQKLTARLEYLGDEPLVQGVVNRLLEQKRLVGDDRRIAHADFKPKLSVNQRKLRDRIVEAHQAAKCQPPEPKEFTNQAGGSAGSLKEIYEVAVAEGHLVKVTDEIYLDSEVEAEMRQRVRERLQAGRGATVAEIRDLLGTTRKFAVPLCEYLDRVGLTKREGDLRVLR